MYNDENESIFTKGFLVKYNLMLSSFPRWFIILTLGLCGMIEGTQWIIRFLLCIFASEPRPLESRMIRFAVAIVISLSRCVIVTFALDWTAFTEYTKQLCQIELEKDDKSVNQIKRQRSVKNWFCFVSLTLYIVLSIIRMLTLLKLDIYIFWTLFVEMVPLIGHFFLLHSILDLSICLKVTFQYINAHLAHFKISSYNQMLSELRRNRIWYSCAIRSSKEAEKFARHYIAWFYFQFILFNIVNIVEVLGEKERIGFTFFLFMVLDIINVAYLTVKLVAVNKVSTEGMEDLYEISYDLKSYNLQNENNLFLNRMLWQNVGFTFSNLFLINPNFITSLLSFMLTIALTMANFLYK